MQEIEACKQAIIIKYPIDLHLKFVEDAAFGNRRRRGEKESDVNKEELGGLCFLRNRKIKFEFSSYCEGHSTVVDPIVSQRMWYLVL